MAEVGAQDVYYNYDVGLAEALGERDEGVTYEYDSELVKPLADDEEEEEEAAVATADAAKISAHLDSLPVIEQGSDRKRKRDEGSAGEVKASKTDDEGGERQEHQEDNTGDDDEKEEEEPEGFVSFDVARGGSATVEMDALTEKQDEVHQRGEGAEEKAGRIGGEDPPWAPNGDVHVYKRIRAPMARLHREIADFTRFVTPSEEEEQAREAAMKRIEAVMQQIWPSGRLEVFGSFATGMYLPTSDVDAVILGTGCDESKEGLRALAVALARNGVGEQMQLITKSKVPIVKLREKASGIDFDVSFEVSGGPAAAEFVRREAERLPLLKPLACVLKLFMQQRDLNEVYTGGLGSYALLVLLISFLKQYPEEKNMGVLLLHFFDLYGRQIDQERVGISCLGGASGGAYFNKHEFGFFDPSRPWLFAIQDPQDPSNDVGKQSFCARQIRSAFAWACTMLESPVAEGPLLTRILRPDSRLTCRPPPPMEGLASWHSNANAFQYRRLPGDLSDSLSRRSKRGGRRDRPARRPNPRSPS